MNNRKGLSKKKAIVLGGQYGGLSVVKALAMEGVPVILLSPNPHDHACHSRFVSQQFSIPNPKDDNDGLLDLLMNTHDDWEGSLLIPTLDEYVIFLSQNRAELKKKYLFTVQDWEIAGKIIDKDKLYPQAQEVCVPVPRFFLPDSPEFLNMRRDEFFFPCILKPNESYKFRDIYHKKVLMANNFDELSELFMETYRHNLTVMISEIIPGDDSSIYSYRSYIDSQGNFLGEICTQKLRQYPTGFGQGSVVRTIPMIPEVRDQAQNLLRSLSYRGQSSTEFRLDYRDNQYKLMEINIRPVVTEWLFVKAGMNFPYMTYLDLVEDTRIPSSSYRQDFYWIHNLWETAKFFETMKAGTLNVREFFEPFWKDKVYVVPFSDDPIHYFLEVYHNMKKVFNRAPKHI